MNYKELLDIFDEEDEKNTPGYFRKPFYLFKYFALLKHPL